MFYHFSDFQKKEFPKSSLYILKGNDLYLIQTVAKDLANRLLSPDLLEFNYYKIALKKEEDLNDLACLIFQYPVLSETKVIHLKEVHNFKKMNKLIIYLKDIPDFNKIILEFFEENKKKNKIEEDLKIESVIINCCLTHNYVLNWLKGFFKNKNLKINFSTINFLIEKLGLDFSALNQELQKISCFFKKGEEITSEKLIPLISENIQVKLFQLSESLASRNLKNSLKILEDLYKKGENELVILAHLNNYFRLILQLKYLRDLPLIEISKKLAKSSFYLKNCLKYIDLFSEWELKKIFKLFLKIDLRIKNNLEPQLSLELLSYQICNN